MLLFFLEHSAKVDLPALDKWIICSAFHVFLLYFSPARFGETFWQGLPLLEKAKKEKTKTKSTCS